MDAELDRIFDFNSTGPPELALAFRPSQDSNGLVTKLEAAAGAGDLMAVQSLWEELQLHPSAWYWTKDTGALFAAVKNQCRSVICFLLGQGMRPTNREARPVAQHRDLATLELFLRHGWDINEAAGASNPSILYEVIHDDELRSFLLSHGADPNARGVYDDTPLSKAVRYAPFSTVNVLFDHGGTVHAGQLLHHAVYRTQLDTSQVMDFLCSRGGELNKIMYEDYSVSFIANIYTDLGTPLHFAAGSGDVRLVRLLVERGAHPLIEDMWGGTPLEVAEYKGHEDIAAYLRPITEASPPAQHQLTRRWRGQGFGRENVYAPAKAEGRL